MEWIRVEERMPHPTEDILMFIHDRDGRDNIVSGYFSYEGGFWVTGVDADDYIETYIISPKMVTHWMLLPEPPQR